MRPYGMLENSMQLNWTDSGNLPMGVCVILQRTQNTSASCTTNLLYSGWTKSVR